MRLRSVFVAAAAFLGFGALAAPASAGLLDDLLSGPGGVLGQTAGGVSDATCGPFAEVPLLPDVLCALDIVNIKYRTTYRKPNGSEFVRTTNGTVAVPSLLRVDEDLITDVTATLIPKSTTKFQLKVQRNALVGGDLPVKLEVILADPSGDLERENLYFGFDSRNGKTPSTWTADIRILQSTDFVTSLGFEVNKGGSAAIPRIAMIGGMFDGDPGQRSRPIEAVLDQQPMPTTFAASLYMTHEEPEDYIIGAGASSPVRLDGTVHIDDGVDDRTIKATVSDLPTFLNVELDAMANNRQRVNFSAANRIGSLGLISDHKHLGVPVDRLQVDLTDVPKALTFEQTSKKSGNISTADGSPIGSAQLLYQSKGFSAGVLPGNGAFAQYETSGLFTDTDAPSMLAVRIEKMTNAAYDMADGTFVDLLTQDVTPTSARQDLALRAVDKNTTVDGTLVDLPPQVRFSMNKAGRIFYNGYGNTVPSVTAKIRTLNGTKLSPTVRYTGVDAALTDLPSAVNADIAPDGNKFSASTQGDPIGSLQAEAFTAEDKCLNQLVATDSGAVMVDTPAAACVGGRFAGLKSAEVGLKPVDLTVRAAAGQKLQLLGTFNDAQDHITPDGHLSGVVDQIPAVFDLATTRGAEGEGETMTSYRINNSAEVARIELDGSDLPEDFPGRFLDVELLGIPKKATVQLPINGRGDRVVAEMGDGADIDSITAEVRSGGPSCLAKLGTESGMAFSDVNLVTCAAGRFRGLKYADVEASPLALDIKSSAAQKFLVEGAFNALNDSIVADGRLSGFIENLPTELSIKENPGVLPQFAESTRLVVDNNAAIDRIHLEGSDLPAGFPGRFLTLDLLEVPKKVTVELPKDGGEDQIRVEAGEGAHLDRIEAEVRTGGPSCLANLGTESGMAFNDINGVRCAGGRFLGLKDAFIEMEPLAIKVHSLISQKFLVEARLNDATDSVSDLGFLSGAIENLPQSLDLQQSTGTVASDPDAETLRFDISTFPLIDAITLNGTHLPESFPSRILNARIEGLPEQLSVEIPTEGAVKKISATTTGGGVDLVRLVLKDDGSSVSVPEGEDAVRVEGDNVAVQVHDLQEVQFVSPLNASPLMSGTAKARVVHDEPAKKLTVRVDADGTVVGLDVPAPPQTLDFERPGQNSPTQQDAQQDVIKFRNSGPITDAVFSIAQGEGFQLNLDVSDIPARTNLCLWSGNGALTSPVDAHNDAMCYQPSKTPFDDGGDPFTVLDTLQLSLDNLDGAMTTPITINNLRLRKERADDDWSETEVQFAQIGEAQIAFGSNTIYPDGTGDANAAQGVLYGDIFDGSSDENEGAHIALNTDDLGVRLLLRAERNTPNVEDKIGFTYLKLMPAEPLVADHKVLALDLTNVPTKTYDRGGLTGCSTNENEMQLVVDIADTVNFSADGLLLLGLLGCLTE